MAKRPVPFEVPVLRGKLWLDRGGRAVVSDHAIDLLEQIDACGSLSEAARRLRFAYRRAWLMLDAMNGAWPTPVVITATGGKQGGGAKLTERGRHVVRAYRDLQLELEHLLDTAGDPFTL